MSAMVRRYWTQQLGLPRQVKLPARIWRSTDLKGPLARETIRALVEAIRSLPRQSSWPDVDKGWWQSVLNDRRLKRDAVSHQRLDQLPVNWNPHQNRRNPAANKDYATYCAREI